MVVQQFESRYDLCMMFKTLKALTLAALLHFSLHGEHVELHEERVHARKAVAGISR